MNRKNRMIYASAAMVWVCVSAVQAEETVFAWDPSARQTAFGTVTAEYADGADVVTRLSVRDPRTDPGTVVLTGRTDFAFAPVATVDFAGGTVRFETPVTAGALALRIADDPDYLCSTNAFDDYLYETAAADGPKLLFPGCSVDDYDVSAVYFDTLAFSDAKVVDFAFQRRGPGTLSIEAQALKDSIIKGARITLFDGDDGIYGSVDHAGYYYGSAYEVSLDDVAALARKSGNRLPVVRDPDNYSGYAVRYVSIVPRRAANEVVFAGSPCDAASVSVDSDTVLTLDGATGGVMNADIALAGRSRLTVRDLDTAAFTGGFTATNAVVTFARSLPDDPRPPVTTSIVQAVSSSTGVLLLENARVDEITAVDVPFLVKSVSSECKPVVCFVKRSPGRLEFQNQVEDEWLKGSQIELYQNGAHIFARRLYSMYAELKYGPPGRLDMLSSDVTLKEKWVAADNYHPGGVDLTLPGVSVFSRKETVDVTFSDTKSRLILSDTRIEDITGVFADRLYGSIKTEIEPLYCFEKRRPGRLEFQLQLVEDVYHVKVSRYVFEQKGPDVWGSRTLSYWASLNDVPAAGIRDFTDPDVPLAGSTTGASYYPQTLEIRLLRRPSMKASVAGMGTATASGVSLNIGSNVTFLASGTGTANSLPRQGTVTVDGMLRVAAAGAIGTGRIDVRPGGMLVFETKNIYTTTTDQKISVDGGTFHTIGNAQDGENYLNSLALKNGAYVFGAGLRVGVSDLTWSADGFSPSTVDVPIRCVSGRIGNEFVMTWAVADVTGDAETDLYMNGAMSDFEDGAGGAVPNGGMIHRKTGAGTLRWGGTSICTGLVQVVEGTLLLGNPGALNTGTVKGGQWAAKQPVEIAGGTLALEPSVSVTAASLSVTASGALDVPAGASFSVDVPGTFADGATLSVSLAEDASLTFGARLTTAQLRAISVNGLRAAQHADGSIDDVPPPTTLIVR